MAQADSDFALGDQFMTSLEDTFWVCATITDDHKLARLNDPLPAKARDYALLALKQVGLIDQLIDELPGFERVLFFRESMLPSPDEFPVVQAISEEAWNLACRAEVCLHQYGYE